MTPTVADRPGPRRTVGRRTVRGTAFAVVLAALLACLPGMPAGASTVTWIPASCATAAFTGHAVEPVGGPFPVNRVRLTGWIEPCAELPAGARFATLTYTGRQATFNTVNPPLRAYGAATGPTWFTTTVDVRTDTLSESDHPQAHCVLLDGRVRLACVGLDTAGLPRVTTVVPIGTDDVRVRDSPVVMVPTRNHTPDPVCGTCV
ncbi:hypothetical protein [Solwaraspora sp. WMMA2101]|uniref:hypothetical protein n=1 Tax=Solwaraspora sp. WMMA2101 TaxID=3404124 RepID=UPI003B93F2D3